MRITFDRALNAGHVEAVQIDLATFLNGRCI